MFRFFSKACEPTMEKCFHHFRLKSELVLIISGGQAHLTAVAGKIARLREGVKLTGCSIEFLSPHYSLFHFS